MLRFRQRFQKTADGTYFGIMEPLYNVLSLTVRHFRDRFADQPWIIYDARLQKTEQTVTAKTAMLLQF